MREDFIALDTLRVEISQGISEMEILFQKISEYEENREITFLAEIGKKVCHRAKADVEKLETAIDTAKNGL